ncbi:hypothetical protein PRIO_1694 [Paenibacillus riograndensis SBR5]|uniref:Uncharacterized protein n=1 Tax=Paenibacillus riograndensis SBR5 TaxID=1073571 RepID=A0A0E4H8B3_9BACL|nr:hypothetical protein PRIO_1694 [Paenibacillus riograndensis SBR5]
MKGKILGINDNPVINTLEYGPVHYYGLSA